MTHEIVFYRAPDADRRIEVIFRDESFWMPQKAIAKLSDVKVPAISKHLKNIFESAELTENSVVSISETTVAANCDGFRSRHDHDGTKDCGRPNRKPTLSILESFRQEAA